MRLNGCQCHVIVDTRELQVLVVTVFDVGDAIDTQLIPAGLVGHSSRLATLFDKARDHGESPAGWLYAFDDWTLKIIHGMTNEGLRVAPQRQKDYEAYPEMGEARIVITLPDGTLLLQMTPQITTYLQVPSQAQPLYRCL
ncbi:MAG TPA: hypothetical protein PK593_00245 [Thermomicrobiales bacterium]|jgi:hypothetical protein|nr:hypothetical protein [Thermomicrobiales bacterium]HQZ91390.1 hypothetical protein [Thermomicrobiales bacterium]HRA31819.1 hypothetical protein [Thermomicrobiales bacterium]